MANHSNKNPDHKDDEYASQDYGVIDVPQMADVGEREECQQQGDEIKNPPRSMMAPFAPGNTLVLRRRQIDFILECHIVWHETRLA